MLILKRLVLVSLLLKALRLRLVYSTNESYFLVNPHKVFVL